MSEAETVLYRKMLQISFLGSSKKAMFLRKLSKNRENMIYFQIRLSSDTSSSQDVLIALLLVYYRINLCVLCINK